MLQVSGNTALPTEAIIKTEGMIKILITVLKRF